MSLTDEWAATWVMKFKAPRAKVIFVIDMLPEQVRIARDWKNEEQA